MTELSHENYDATKVIAKACTWADRRKAVQIAPASEKAREAGRYAKSGDDLAEAVEQYRSMQRRAGDR